MFNQNKRSDFMLLLWKVQLNCRSLINSTLAKNIVSHPLSYVFCIVSQRAGQRLASVSGLKNHWTDRICTDKPRHGFSAVVMPLGVKMNFTKV